MRRGTARAAALDAPLPSGRWPIVRPAGEQSNTSLMFGRRFMLKLFRRLEPGPNPELEISRFLTGRGFTHIPPLAAGLEYERAGDEPTSLALLQAFVANTGTAWEQAVHDVRRSLLGDAPVAPATKTVSFLPSATALGQRTAEFHLALGAGDDPAFAPEAFTADHVAEIVAHLKDDVDRSLALLADRLDTLPHAAQDRARHVLDAHDRLTSHAATFATVPARAMRTRVHGDYHLGQVLCAGQDFVIIDFEGEPARPLAERRAKQSPLKDVAGMLRSFSYAAYATWLAESEQHPDLSPRFEARAHKWEAAVSAAFLTRYRQTMARAALVPADDHGFGRLLDAFLLEKALYELRYELASRPRWVSIPLLGVLRILDGHEGRP